MSPRTPREGDSSPLLRSPEKKQAAPEVIPAVVVSLRRNAQEQERAAIEAEREAANAAAEREASVVTPAVTALRMTEAVAQRDSVEPTSSGEILSATVSSDTVTATRSWICKPAARRSTDSIENTMSGIRNTTTTEAVAQRDSVEPTSSGEILSATVSSDTVTATRSWICKPAARKSSDSIENTMSGIRNTTTTSREFAVTPIAETSVTETTSVTESESSDIMLTRTSRSNSYSTFQGLAGLAAEAVQALRQNSSTGNDVLTYHRVAAIADEGAETGVMRYLSAPSKFERALSRAGSTDSLTTPTQSSLLKPATPLVRWKSWPPAGSLVELPAGPVAEDEKAAEEMATAAAAELAAAAATAAEEAAAATTEEVLRLQAALAEERAASTKLTMELAQASVQVSARERGTLTLALAQPMDLLSC